MAFESIIFKLPPNIQHRILNMFHQGKTKHDVFLALTKDGIPPAQIPSEKALDRFRAYLDGEFGPVHPSLQKGAELDPSVALTRPDQLDLKPFNGFNPRNPEGSINALCDFIGERINTLLDHQAYYFDPKNEQIIQSYVASLKDNLSFLKSFIAKDGAINTELVDKIVGEHILLFNKIMLETVTQLFPKDVNKFKKQFFINYKKFKKDSKGIENQLK